MLKPKCYLSGSIEFAKDAVSWREYMFRELHYKYDVIIPDPIKCPFTKTDSECAEWVKQHYVMPDMADVSSCKHFFVIIDHAYSSGTYGELSLASWLNKDIICFLDGVKLEELPLWIIGCLSGSKFVNSIEDAIKYYKELK